MEDEDDFNPDPPPRTKVGVAALVILAHVVVILGLIRAFAPDFTAKAVETVLSTFSVTITTPPPPKPAPEPAKAGKSGDAGKKAVAREVNAPQPKISVAKTPAPKAASTGSANTSGASNQGGGTGLNGGGNGPGSGGDGNGSGGGHATKVAHISGQIDRASDFPVPPGGREARGRIVFIGPCTAKKAEIRDPDVVGVIEVALTFDELRAMLEEAGVALTAEPDSEFDPPRAMLGRVFPVSGGLLRTAAVQQDVLDNRILVTDGMLRVQRLIEDLQRGEVHAGIVDVLMCEGCINGPVMGGQAGEFARKELVSDYVTRGEVLSPREAEAFLAQYDDVDLTRAYTAPPIVAPMPSEEEIKEALASINKFSEADELNCMACGYATCREKAIAVCQGLAEACERAPDGIASSTPHLRSRGG